MTGCEGKKVYPTYWQANRSANELNRHREKAKANIYKCDNCRNWHCGNSIHSGQRKQPYKRIRYV